MTSSIEIQHGICIGRLGDFYRGPFERLPENYPIRKIHAFNIPKSAFRQNPRNWGDLTHDTCFAKILHSVAHIVSNGSIGTYYTRPSGEHAKYLCAEGVPKVVVGSEELVSTSDTGRMWLGFRMWLFIMDEKFDLGLGFHRIMDGNATRAQQLRRQRKNLPADACSGEHLTIRGLEDIYTNVWKPYLCDSNYIKGGVETLMESNDMDISNPDSPLHPSHVLTVENAFRLHVDDVCSEQLDINNYFNTDEGISPVMFMADETGRRTKQFPLPTSTFRITVPFFEPKHLETMPLPNSVILELMERSRDRESRQASLQESRSELRGIVQGADPQEIQRAQERVDEQQRVIEQIDEDTSALVSNMQRENRDNAVFYDGSGAMGVMTSRNIFMQIRERNHQKLNEIKDKYDVGTEEYDTHMQAFRKQAIREFEKEFKNSECVTGAVKCARAFMKGLLPEEQYIENLQIARNLSPFGNMIIRMTAEFDKIFQVEANFDLIWLAYGVMLSAYRYSWDLRPNLMLTGEGGAGKSFVLEFLETISIGGSVWNVTHFTPQSFNTGQDMSDICIVMHEIPTSLLGIDNKGNRQVADPFFKNRLAKQYTATISYDFDKETGERKSKMSYARCMGSMIAASNERMPLSDSAIMQRFIKYKMQQRSRGDRNPQEMTYINEWSKEDQVKLTIQHGYKLHQLYFLIYEKAIEAGVLPEIDIEGAKQVARLVFSKLSQNGLPYPKTRQICMYFDLARVFTIFYAIEVELFSEYGFLKKQDESSNHKPFNFDFLEDFIKWGYCTEEIAVFVITLLEKEWVPKIKYQIINHIGKDQCKWPPKSPDDVDIDFRKVESSTPNAALEIDYRYIEIVGSNINSIASNIRNSIPDRPSLNDIISELYDLRNTFISTQPREWRKSEENAALLESLDNAQDLFSPPPSTQDMNVEDLQSSRLQRVMHQLELNDVQEVCVNCNEVCVNCNKALSTNVGEICKDCGTHAHLSCSDRCNQCGHYSHFSCMANCVHCSAHCCKKCLAKHIDLLPIPESHHKQVPCVLIEDFPGAKNTHKRRICIAVDMIGRDYVNVLRDCVCDALAHRCQYEQQKVCITALPYRRDFPAEVEKAASLPDHVTVNPAKQTFYRLFDTLTIEKKKDKAIFIPNYFNYTPAEELAIYARVESKKRISEFHKRAGNTLNTDMDYMTMSIYWEQNAIDVASSEVAFPPSTFMFLWGLRDTDLRYTEMNEHVLQDYPEDWMKQIDENVKSRKEIEEKTNEGKITQFRSTDQIRDRRRLKLDLVEASDSLSNDENDDFEARLEGEPRREEMTSLMPFDSLLRIAKDRFQSSNQERPNDRDLSCVEGILSDDDLCVNNLFRCDSASADDLSTDM